jgi:hypothetical protein
MTHTIEKDVFGQENRKTTNRDFFFLKIFCFCLFYLFGQEKKKNRTEDKSDKPSELLVVTQNVEINL